MIKVLNFPGTTCVGRRSRVEKAGELIWFHAIIDGRFALS